MTSIISNFYERYLSIALISSLLIHLTIIFTYYIIEYYNTDEQFAEVVRLIPYINIPQTGIIEEPPVLVPKITSATIPPKQGIPVPVPESEVSPEQTIPTQKQLSGESNPLSDYLNQGGTLSATKPELKIEEAEPPIFVAVEKPPIPVKLVHPTYPEIALRSNMEGTVWVKIWVTKEGKAKKALVVKSDSDVFNEAAIAAALQWIFTPAMMNSGPVAVWATVPFKFHLKKE